MTLLHKKLTILHKKINTVHNWKNMVCQVEYWKCPALESCTKLQLEAQLAVNTCLFRSKNNIGSIVLSGKVSQNWY